ncbi:MAG TPA: response regulator transcription factor [Polyangiaceae bacterium]|jgi:DNA-binding response OmpR family regulator|nr:response regulator transcription factor [Polyangiaceae bacterium]
MARVFDSPRKRVLVIEDDPSITLGLRINLESEGYEVLEAEDGEAGLSMAREQAPDLVILDVMLPKLNGFQVLQTVRREGLMMPIIVLSARTGEMEKVTGLELGAEDYVAKPFSLAELLARVRAALRRGPRPAENVHRAVHTFGEVRIDVAARLITRNGAPVEMTATELDVLLCLIEARGAALTREDIFSRVWGPNHHGTPRTIDNFIQQLRAKLEPDPQKPRYVQTVRGIGYRFDG